MEFKTKFNHNDEVYIITKHMTYKDEMCETCNNKGIIKVKDKAFTCPDCGGRIRRTADKQKWGLYQIPSGVVGKIMVSSYSKEYIRYDRDNKDLKISYMLDETGIGSGSVWDEEDLFGNYKEAVEECDKRNKDV